MQKRRKLDPDQVAWTHDAALQDNTHHPSLADKRVRLLFDALGKQARLKVFNLNARVAKAGELDHGIRTKPQSRAGRQAKQTQIARTNVFAEIAGKHSVSLGMHFVEQLGLHQVHLPQVGMLPEPLDVIEMLIRGSGTGVALDAPVLDQPDGFPWRFAEFVFGADMDGNDHG